MEEVKKNLDLFVWSGKSEEDLFAEDLFTKEEIFTENLSFDEHKKIFFFKTRAR